MQKKFSVLLITVVLAGVLAACGVGFDAGNLVEANLDIIYKNEYTEAELKQHNTTEEEAQEIYQDGLQQEAEYFADYFDIDLTLLSEETNQRILDMYAKIYAASNYEVGKVTTNGDIYKVDVKVYPITIMADFINEDADAIMDAWQQRMDSGELTNMTDEEFEEAWADGIISGIEARTDNITYDDSYTITVEVSKDSDGYYVISDDGIGRIDELIIAY